MIKSTREIISTILISGLVLVNLTSAAQFTARDLHKMKKLSSTAVSPDGKYAVYGISQWDESTGKSSSHLEYIEISTGVVKQLTEGPRDSSPVFNSAYPGVVLFLSGRSGSSQAWYVPFPAGDTLPTPVKLTNYEVDIDNIIFRGNGLAFSAEVYFDCAEDVFKCTSEKNKVVEARGANSWGVYTKMFVRHWDTWLTEGKGYHVFLQEITQDAESKLPKIDQPIKDLMKGFEANSPVPPYGGTDHFDLSPDGSAVVFSLHERNEKESWNTGWKTYYIDTKGTSSTPKHITAKIEARTQNPRFSPDGSKVAYLAMKRPGLESDNLHLEIYDTVTGSVSLLTDEYDRSVIDYLWVDGNTIIFTATDIQANKLFFVNVDNKSSITILTSGNFAYGTPSLINYEQKKLLVTRSSWTSPDELVTFTLDLKNKKLNDLTVLFNPNKDALAPFNLSDAEEFHFTGGYGDQVYGWVLKPAGFDEKKTYPLAFLIHGGPEGAWEPSWSYRWNPQLWAHRGYAVVMVNPHGSSGQGINFQDKVRDDWGGVPYKDLMTGLDYSLATYKFIDSSRMCAVGASYGGYMVNWIQGQTDRFKCLVTHDGVFSTLTMFYATEEIWFPYAEYCPKDNVGCTPFDPKFRERYLKYSPESYVQNWKTPHLIIHGSHDFRIPISEGLAAFTALQVKGIPSRFLHFNMENHWVLRQENSIKWYDEVLGWLDKYTVPKPGNNLKAVESKHTHTHSNSRQFLNILE